MNLAVVYSSGLKDNTSRLANAVARQLTNVTLIDSSKAKMINLSRYDMIGVLSDVHFGRLRKNVMEFMTENLVERSNMFLMYASHNENPEATKKIRQLAQLKKSCIKGEYHYPVSGDAEQINEAVAFVNRMINN